jgi:chemotaxis protein MotA
MATTKKNKAPQPKKATRPDFATFGGLALALAGILGGLLLEKGSIWDVSQLTAAMIVLGGTFGAVLVTTPMAVAWRAIRGLRSIFFEEVGAVSQAMSLLMYFAVEARKNGIIKLEEEVTEISDPFLFKAMALAVDGADLQEIRHMMEIDIVVMEQTAEAEAKVWEAAGGYSPTVGIIGAVLGLIQVMKHLEDIRAVGHGIAVAFVATVYGVALANMLFLPAAAKLRARMRDAVLVKEMLLEGVASIAQGLNPTLIRLKLESFDPLLAQPKKASDREKPYAKEAA